jgi:hypothetical protein
MESRTRASAQPGNISPRSTDPGLLTEMGIRRRTLILKMDHKGKPYGRPEMGLALSEHVAVEEIVSLGPLQRNAEWYVTLKSEEAKLTLLQLGTLRIRSHQGVFTPAYSREVRMRIHWLPPWVSNECVRFSLETAGFKVITVSDDKSSIVLNNGKSLRHTNINVRSAVVEVRDGQDIPHTFNIMGRTDTYNCLISVLGRQPMCLRCRQIGHYRSNCTTPQCATCGRIGHKAADCSNRYTAALTGRHRQASDEDGDDYMDYDDADGRGTLSDDLQLSSSSSDDEDLQSVPDKGEQIIQDITVSVPVVAGAPGSASEPSSGSSEASPPDGGAVTSVGGCDEAAREDSLAAVSQDSLAVAIENVADIVPSPLIPQIQVISAAPGESSDEDCTPPANQEQWMEVRRKRSRSREDRRPPESKPQPPRESRRKKRASGKPASAPSL